MRKLKQESLDAAFTKLYEETYDSVLRYIICRCAAPSDIGDLVQNTYLALKMKLIIILFISDILLKKTVYELILHPSVPEIPA